MHEGHYTEKIVAEILEQVKKGGGHKATKVLVKVGEIFHLEPESVRLHFDLVSQQTLLAGAVLELEEIPARVKCRVCGTEGTLEDHHVMMCPECASMHVDLISGNSIIVDRIEFEASER